MSIISFSLVLVYAVFKFDTFLAKKDSEITASVRDNYFSDKDVFSSKEGFAIAVAFMDADDEPIDLEKGDIKFYKNSWGNDADGAYYEDFSEIPSHICTDEDLGLDDSGNS